MNQTDWLLFVVSLPGPTKTARMRLWRALRTCGAAALRDGAYVLPDRKSLRQQFDALADEVRASGGSAEILTFVGEDAAQDGRLRGLFDRGEDYARLLERTRALTGLAQRSAVTEPHRRLAVLRREASQLDAIDFFPGPAHAQLAAALADAADALGTEDEGEPHAAGGRIARRDAARYRGRPWATRQHLWVDRAASAWLIRRFIDKEAKFRWLRDPRDCPKRAVGFDFDGAEFTHVGARVTFEVLLVAFGLERDAALVRIGTLVHALDVGGAPVAEAAGLAAIFGGYRARELDDDALLAESSRVFDALHAAFSKTPETPA